MKRSEQRVCKPKHAAPDERGVALIVSILIVGLMSVLALETLQSLRNAVRVSVNVADREQTRLYALGAETYAAISLGQILKPGDSVRPLVDTATREVIKLPIEDGLIEIRLSDGANCYNLNALVTTDAGDGLVQDAPNATRLVRLLVAVSVPESQATDLGHLLVDWIDGDGLPGVGGAEDDYYNKGSDPFRTPNQLLVDVSEVNAVPGMTGALRAVLAPLVCVRPTQELSPLNVNSIQVEDAPLLAAYLGEEFNLQDALEIIAARPPGGFEDIEEFWALKPFVSKPLSEEDKILFALVSEYYDMKGRILRNETALTVHSTLQISDTGEINIVSRRFGVF